MAAVYHVYIAVNNCEGISFCFHFNVHNLYYIFFKLFQGQVTEVSALLDPFLCRKLKIKLVCSAPFTPK
jgi:hypothetical protein